MTDTFEITTQDKDQGIRLDKLLSLGESGLSRSRLKALIEEGVVTLSGQTITDPSLRVKSGQCFSFKIPEAKEYEPEPEDIALEIVYEDDDLIVLNKPAGMVVHPAAGNYTGTLVNALLHHCGDSLSGIGGVKRPGIVHRLDKETSGLMVVAKNDIAHVALSEQFAEHSLERAYLAVVWGLPEPKKGRIEGNIGRSPQNRKKMAVVTKGGKTAATNYSLVKQIGLHASLVECRLETGRTHQIRVHMSNKSNTVVGDALYGRTPPRFLRLLNAEQKAEFSGFQRHALHAYIIGFLHPRTKEEMHFENDLPSEINELCDFLKKI
ncbi:Ribosomal large subunit pseudouridine synthase D [Candidatus Terasakiella magnetica]|uniref:Pseudouridine synthase n=1 Tax=Candidatus Terasakiella magnetica TaxID=1867952 RepID=A0A1C3RL88_9PROT|nr:RluA family pseudouridine synthase [Candidatus Terasakiella magnetica]SCA58021.1 Ribosomal large subunit pseudouridine synthase D [Candidatus Terasakiella magnetica]